jgi:hypothetical protein
VALTFTNPEAQSRYQGWYNAATSMGLPADVAEQIAGGGIRWAGENEPGKGPGWAGADLSAYSPNTFNPAQALSFYARGGLPNQYQWSGRADVGGNARNLTSITPPGLGAPEDATSYIADWRDYNGPRWGSGTAPGQVAQGASTLYQHLNMALNPMQETFYQTNPQLLWGQVGHGFAPNWEAPRGDWWRQRYTQAQNDYANASATGTDPNLSFVSWLNSQYPHISQEFGLLPAAARGENAPFLPAGRPQL